MLKDRLQRELAIKAVFILIVAGCAYWLKKIYSMGNSESLRWIVEPTAKVVEYMSGIPFVHEVGVGWVNHQYQVAIVPSCAGGNFLILLFCMVAFQVIHAARTARGMACMIAATSLFAYGVTLLVNSLRIWLSIGLYRADIYSRWLTPELVHRIAGVCLYYCSLCFSYFLVSFILRQVASKTEGSRAVSSVFSREQEVVLLPLFWYLLITIAIPYMNNGYSRNPDQFILHALTVTGVSVLCTAAILLLGKTWRQKTIG